MEDSQSNEYEEKFGYRNKNGWTCLNEKEKDDVFKFAEDYKTFISKNKTEREVTREIIKIAEDNGFVDIEKTSSLKSGNKVYYNNKGKSLVMAVIGKQPLQNGFNAVAAHIDSPRLDLKPNPLYEENNLGLFKTHYYGGIKKYQWVTVPLSIHGVIIKRNGDKLNINIGENDGEPILYITDLLIHLSNEQMNKKVSEAITGESLNAVVGGMPMNEHIGVKDNLLKLLNEKYGIVEEDLLSSELELVPSYKPKDVGFDKSMIAAYGQDDRVCAYPELRSILNIVNPERTVVAIFTDKEEIGSMGNTGLQSRFFENAIAEILERTKGSTDLKLRRAMVKSKLLSADVTSACDPTYPDVTDKLNSAYIGHGICLIKYTGSKGKAGSSDANAEFLGEIRKLFNDNNVKWQPGEIGKVDKGGGGTVAQYLANYGIDVIDCGVPLLSMHSPYELSSKLDVYMAYKAYKAFMES